jgi:hypothetical protein
LDTPISLSGLLLVAAPEEVTFVCQNPGSNADTSVTGWAASIETVQVGDITTLDN